ncbi:hypothetical protein ABYF34_06415 [Buchananella felis]|uniref:hypothetical protein n=1 Tax=Buchananella felis TaxID=3231492 RepID=UPI003527FF68
MSSRSGNRKGERLSTRLIAGLGTCLIAGLGTCRIAGRGTCRITGLIAGLITGLGTGGASRRAVSFFRRSECGHQDQLYYKHERQKQR